MIEVMQILMNIRHYRNRRQLQSTNTASQLLKSCFVSFVIVTLGLKPPKSGHQDHTMHPRGYFLWPGRVVSFKRQEGICQSLCFRKLIIYFESQET